MLSKSFTASIFLLALTSSVNAGCVISPPLGISGSPGANDVLKPSDASPCGGITIAQHIDSSQAIQADGSGQFAPSITNFDTGASGSRSIKTVKIDQSGTGINFVDAEIVNGRNGDENPTSLSTQQLAVKLPDGTKCVGGSEKNRCLASFVTDAGFGNCVVVTQAESTEKGSTSTTDAGKAQTNGQDGDKTKQSQKTEGDKTEGSKPMHKKRMMMKRH